MIYFVQAEDGGPIKIGLCTDIKSRLASMQTGNHKRLWVLAYIPGGMVDEKRLHERFSRYRVRGEWFEPSADLLAYIQTLESHPLFFQPAAYIKPHELTHPGFFKLRPDLYPADPWSAL